MDRRVAYFNDTDLYELMEQVNTFLKSERLKEVDSDLTWRCGQLVAIKLTDDTEWFVQPLYQS